MPNTDWTEDEAHEPKLPAFDDAFWARLRKDATEPDDLLIRDLFTVDELLDLLSEGEGHDAGHDALDEVITVSPVSRTPSDPEQFRFAVGRHSGVLRRTDPYRGVIVIGAVRSGKTTGAIVPALARQRVRTIAISVRADVINATLPARYDEDDVWIVDPMGMLRGHRTVGWNPLRLCVNWDACVDFAHSFVTSASMSGILDSGFWYAKAAQLLTPLLLAAAKNERSIADVSRWVRTEDDFEVRALLQCTGEELAISSFEAIAGLEDRARGSIYTTLHGYLRVFDSAQVIASTTGNGLLLGPSRLARTHASSLPAMGSVPTPVFVTATSRHRCAVRSRPTSAWQQHTGPSDPCDWRDRSRSRRM